MERDRSSNCKTTTAVVKKIIEEILTSVCKFRNIPHDGEFYQFRCEECGRRFKKKKYLMEHIRIFHRKKFNFNCQLCDYKTYRSKNLKVHMKVVHPTIISEAKRHSAMNVPSNINKKKCNKCEYVTKYQGKIHKLALLEDKGGFPRENSFLQISSELDCPDQKDGKVEIESDTDSVEIFTDDSNDYVKPALKVTEALPCFSKNEKNGLGEEKIWSCKTCGKVFKKKYNLKVHERKSHKHNPLVFKCGFIGCDFATVYKGALAMHRRKHSPLVHKCDFGGCGFATWNKSILFLHKKKHTNEKTLYKCSECDLVSPTSYQLKRHKFLVHNIINFDLKCPECDVVPHTYYQLKRHKFFVHNIGKLTFDLKCSECELVYPTYNDLKKHKSLVHNIGKLNCEDCSFFTHISGDLKMHRVRYHPEKLVLDSSSAHTE